MGFDWVGEPNASFKTKLVNNLARLLFTSLTRNKNSLTMLFSDAIFEVILGNVKVMFGILGVIFKVKVIIFGVVPETNRESQQYSGTALGRLRVQLEE